jgi:uncharacterized membrane protein YhaH (DUF805 family)
MTFTEAIKDGFDHYVKFDGRASRPAYWWWFLFAVLVSIAANIIDAAIGTFGIVSGIAGLALLLPGLSVAIRRLHDTNRSGWWILIGLIPIIGWIVLLVFYLQPSDTTENRFGPPPASSAPAAPSPA